MNAGKALAASMLPIPSSRIPWTSRSCSVRLARSTRPLAWEELAHRISTLISASARPNWVMPCPLAASAFATRKIECLSE